MASTRLVAARQAEASAREDGLWQMAARTGDDAARTPQTQSHSQAIGRFRSADL